MFLVRPDQVGYLAAGTSDMPWFVLYSLLVCFGLCPVRLFTGSLSWSCLVFFFSCQEVAFVVLEQSELYPETG
jgi:hypothetical protein